MNKVKFEDLLSTGAHTRSCYNGIKFQAFYFNEKNGVHIINLDVNTLS